MPYAIMAKGSPWVTSSFLCKNWPEPSAVCLTTSVAQWRYQLKVNCTAHLVLDQNANDNAYSNPLRHEVWNVDRKIIMMGIDLY